MLDLTSVFADFPVLETERFILRAAQPEDAEDIFRIMSNPAVTRYFGRKPMTDYAEAVERVEVFQSCFAERIGIRWVIAPRDSGRMIGSCGFWRLLPQHHRAEIGYELAPEWWSSGVMTEAVGAILGFGFTRMGLHSVEANIHPDNIGSRRVLEKLGFVQEGYFRESCYEPVTQDFSDAAVFSLLQADWRGAK